MQRFSIFFVNFQISYAVCKLENIFVYKKSNGPSVANMPESSPLAQPAHSVKIILNHHEHWSSSC